MFRFSTDAPTVRGEETMRNGRFQEGFSGWVLDDAEIDGAASFSVGPEGARIEVPLATVPGTAYLRQKVPLEAGAYELVVETKGRGDFLGFALLVRETGFEPGIHPIPFLDTVLSPPVTPGLTTSRFLWHPRQPTSTEVEIFLRVAFRGGDSGDATFRSASFVPVTSTAWSFGDGTPVERGAQVTHRFARPGAFSVLASTWHPGEPASSRPVRVEVANVPPEPRLDLGRVGASGRFVADATSSRDPDGVEARVSDPSFDEGAAGWGFSSAETGVEGSMSVEAGVLRLRAGPTRFAGSVFAFQDVGVVARRAYTLEVQAQDRSGVEAYELIVRERGSLLGVQDHRARFDPVGEGWTALRMHVAPRFHDSTAFTIHLRVLAEPGAHVDASFDDVVLREDLSYEWTLDGEPLPGTGPRVDLHPRPGNHTLGLVVRDAAGASARVDAAFDAALPEAAPRPAILAPSFARVWDPALFLAAGSRPALVTQGLANGAFDDLDGWEVAGDVSASGGAALLRAGRETAAELRQRVPLDPFTAYELHLRYRASAPATDATRLEVVLEETTVEPGGVVHVRERHVERLVPTATGWQEARIPWSARDPASNEAHVRLRVAGNGSVEIDDVSFGPALEYEWQVGAASAQQGFGVRHVFREPGSALVTLVVRDAYGARNATSIQVPVLGNGSFTAVPALAGGVHLAANLTLHPRFAALEIVRMAQGRETRLDAPLRARFVVADPAPPRDATLDYRLVVTLDNGTREEVAEASLRLAADAPVGEVEAPDRVARGETARLVAVAPADAVRVTGRLSWGPFSRTVEFSPADDAPARWEASYRPGPLAPPGRLLLRVEAVDGAGRSTALGEPQPVRVSLSDAPTDALLLALPLVPIAAWWVRDVRRRDWPWRR